MKRFTLIFAFLLLTANLLHANIIYVPSEQPTIQAGIDVATEGDTVLVASGIYTGDGNRDLNFNGVNLVLKSEMGAALTIIDCQASAEDPHNFIYLNNGEDTTSMLDGFTITNAYFIDAFPDYGDGAIYFKNGVANIQNCKLIDNDVTGILLFYGTTLTPSRISNCYFSGNRVGVYNIKAGTIIENCVLENNNSSGIGFYARTFIKNCLIIHNGWAGISQASGMGGYVNLVEHCTIAFNQIGIYYDRTLPFAADVNLDLDTTLISHTIVAYNTTAGIYNYYDLEHEYNCVSSNVFGNGEYNWQNDKYAHGDEYGNLSVNPLFCDTTVGNYFLGENSPCAAVNNSSGVTIGVYDIGCGCCVGIRGNVDNDLNDQIDIGDLVYLVAFMFRAGPPHQCEDEANIDGLLNTLQVDIGDLVYLVAYMFQGGTEPPACN